MGESRNIGDLISPSGVEQFSETLEVKIVKDFDLGCVGLPCLRDVEKQREHYGLVHFHFSVWPWIFGAVVIFGHS